MKIKLIHSFVTITALLTLTLLACALTPGQSVEEQSFESPAPDKFTMVRLKTSDGQLDPLLKAEVQKAKQQKRQPFVEFYTDWCPDCQALRQSLNDPRMIEAFAGTYIIQLNLDEWKRQLSQTDFVVPGIPMFFEIDEAGNPTGRVITGGAWGENIPENMAPALKSFFRNEKGQANIWEWGVPKFWVM